MTAPSRLLSLPIELQNDIVDLLPFACLHVLHNTHPYFRTLVNLEKIISTTHTNQLTYESHCYALVETLRTGNMHKKCAECFSVTRVEAKKEDPKRAWQSVLTDYYCCSKCCPDRPDLTSCWCRVCAAGMPVVALRAGKGLPFKNRLFFMERKGAADSHSRSVLRMCGRYCRNPLSEYDRAMGRCYEKLRKEQDGKDRERRGREDRALGRDEGAGGGGRN